MKNVALIGVGGYGAVYLNHLLDEALDGNCRFVAAVVRNQSKNQEACERLRAAAVEIFPSEEAMYQKWAGKLALVCIPTGIEFHERMVINALNADADVLVEKPAAGSLAEVDRMIEAEKNAKGRFVAVGFQHGYATEIREIQKLLQSGRLGRVKRISAFGLWPRNDAYYHRNNWAGRKFAADGTPIWDSPINNAFAHYLNISLIFASPRKNDAADARLVSAKLWRVRHDIETFDGCEVHLDADGVEVRNFFCHAVSTQQNPLLRVECENGQVDWAVDNFWQAVDGNGAPVAGGPVLSPHRNMFDTVLARIDDPAQVIYPLSAARKHTAVIEALQGIPVTDVAPEQIWRRESDGQLAADDIPAQVRRDWGF